MNKLLDDDVYCDDCGEYKDDSEFFRGYVICKDCQRRESERLESMLD